MTGTVKTCSECGITKPPSDFYGRQSWCKTCHNAKPQAPSTMRSIRTRAYHRATAQLVKLHQVEFNELYEAYKIEAEIEACHLERKVAKTSAARTYAPGEPIRIRPGSRNPGETPLDRADVGRCPECHRFHDAGHRCDHDQAEVKPLVIHRDYCDLIGDHPGQRCRSVSVDEGAFK